MIPFIHAGYRPISEKYYGYYGFPEANFYFEKRLIFPVTCSNLAQLALFPRPGQNESATLWPQGKYD
jgi:hypothetical protein